MLNVSSLLSPCPPAMLHYAHAHYRPHAHHVAHTAPPPQMSLPFLTMPTPSPASTPATPVVHMLPRAAAAPPPRKALSKPSSRTSSASSAAPCTAKKVRSSKSNIPGSSRYWTPSEHRLFVVALLKYGPKDLKSIAAHVGTRNMIQCRTHEQKCFMRLMREAQRETDQRAAAERAAAAEDGAASAATDVDGGAESASSDVERPSKPAKEVYSVSSNCGITLLSVVGDELSRALSA